MRCQDRDGDGLLSFRGQRKVGQLGHDEADNCDNLAQIRALIAPFAAYPGLKPMGCGQVPTAKSRSEVSQTAKNRKAGLLLNVYRWHFCCQIGRSAQ